MAMPVILLPGRLRVRIIPTRTGSTPDKKTIGTRYTTSGFLRMKLGDALEKRGVAPHIYESATEAEKSLREIEGAGELPTP